MVRSVDWLAVFLMAALCYDGLYSFIHKEAHVRFTKIEGTEAQIVGLIEAIACGAFVIWEIFR